KARFNFHLGPNETEQIELHAIPSQHALRSGVSVREAADAARSPENRPPPLVGELPVNGWRYPGSDEESDPPAPRAYEDRLARAGEVPHTPYYGSVDATPLFIILYSEYLQWTDDRITAQQLLPAAEAALRWISEYGDKDGDGFVEYQRKGPSGLENQGWKDSRDGVPHPDGTPARPPIALIEVQGYCIDALRRMARIYRQLGRREDAAQCTRKAIQLARRIDEAFWDDRTGTYALALDGEKKQVRTIASNMGH